MQGQPVTLCLACSGVRYLPILKDDRIYWNCQPIACILTKTQDQPDHAASLLRVTYEAKAVTTSLAGAKANGIEPGMFIRQPLPGLKITISNGFIWSLAISMSNRWPRLCPDSTPAHITTCWKPRVRPHHRAPPGHLDHPPSGNRV